MKSIKIALVLLLLATPVLAFDADKMVTEANLYCPMSTGNGFTLTKVFRIRKTVIFSYDLAVAKKLPFSAFRKETKPRIVETAKEHALYGQLLENNYAVLIVFYKPNGDHWGSIRVGQSDYWEVK